MSSGEDKKAKLSLKKAFNFLILMQKSLGLLEAAGAWDRLCSREDYTLRDPRPLGLRTRGRAGLSLTLCVAVLSV